ncbi:MAG: hypothetical protein GF310_08575 [candidate division Zixibacteria bacterium]|nr:hypothetical protein [candidate division Zixibacteria bacterium]
MRFTYLLWKIESLLGFAIQLISRKKTALALNTGGNVDEDDILRQPRIYTKEEPPEPGKDPAPKDPSEPKEPPMEEPHEPVPERPVKDPDKPKEPPMEEPPEEPKKPTEDKDPKSPRETPEKDPPKKPREDE